MVIDTPDGGKERILAPIAIYGTPPPPDTRCERLKD